MPTLGERLVGWLADLGIDTVFGIPGVHTIELYRGLAGGLLRHVTPRHEQGAGFMADGYARASGRPAACFVITGPGLTNILTPMAQAHADSIPMLVISSVNPRGRLGMERGDLHEIRNQRLIAAQAAAFSHTVMTVEEVPAILERAFAVFTGARPRPVHIEIPVDLLGAGAGHVELAPWKPVRPPMPATEALVEAAEALASAGNPALLVGGGAVGAAAEIAAVAERLGAPVVMTANARGVLAHDHPLAVPVSPSLRAARTLLAGSDVVLAVGTEIGPTDYDWYGAGDLEVPGTLIRIDIDPEQLHRGAAPDLALIGEARTAATTLLALLGNGDQAGGGPARARAARIAALDEIGPAYRAAVRFLEDLRTALPEAPLVGDSTHAVYAGALAFGTAAPRRWFSAATGYGALGYGLPAAVGAAKALERPVICITGDGGLQFTLAELGVAVEESLPVIVLVWNNRGYGEIEHAMERAGVTPVGTRLATPDFAAIARAWGAAGLRMDDLDALPTLLGEAAARPGPTVIEFDEELVLAGASR